MRKLSQSHQKMNLVFRINMNSVNQQRKHSVLGQNKFLLNSSGNQKVSYLKSAQNFRGNLKKTKIKLPSKFKKQNNKVQINAAILNKSSVQNSIKSCSSSFYKNECFNYRKNTQLVQSDNRNFHSDLNFPQMKRCRKASYNAFQPKTLQSIQNLTAINWKKKQNQRIKLFKKNKQRFANPFNNQNQNKIDLHLEKFKLSRFNLLELKSYYNSLVDFSRGDILKFRYAFQIMLNLSNVTVRQSLLNECIKQLLNGGISFERFLNSFTQIQDRLRKQAIIDYFQILLEDMQSVDMAHQDLLKTFEGRMKKSTAVELTYLLFEKSGKQEGQTINKKDIQKLCYSDEQFCNKFYVLNHENMFANKLKQQRG